MRYAISDSATGDELGVIDVDQYEDDDVTLENLISAGHLDGSADDYEIVEGDFFCDAGTRVVRDEDGPVLALEPDGPGDDDDDEDDEDDEDEEDFDDDDDEDEGE